MMQQQDYMQTCWDRTYLSKAYNLFEKLEQSIIDDDMKVSGKD